MNFNKCIDHTLLKQDATMDQIKLLCKEAREYQFASVCVNPYYVPFCKKLLEGSDVKVCTVIGFPLGANHYLVKGAEAKLAINQGAEEIDMVINVSAVKNHEYDYIQLELEELRKATKGYVLKVILETCLLSKEEIVDVCKMCAHVGADFVKTSTGFSKGGATKEDVALMKDAVNGKCKVKASGGIRDYATMMKMINAGADRIGTSSGTKLCIK